MNASQLFEEIRIFCKSNANEELLKGSQRYFKNPFIGYGLTSPQIHQEVKVRLQQKNLTQSVVLEAMPLFLRDGMYEEISIGLLLLNGLSKEFTRDTLKEIDSFFSMGIDNWAHADMLGMFILPKFLLQNIVQPEDFKPWMESPHKFQRRCVPVTFIKAIKVNKAPVFYMDFVSSLMKDLEREVHQGMGWFLREAWKINHDVVEAFLLEWKETAPRLIIQYACEKMSADEKKRYKRSDQKK